MLSQHPVSTAAAILLLAATGCSQAGEAASSDAQTPPPVAGAPSATRAPSVAEPDAAEPDASASRVLGKRDFTLRGAAACDIDFVYSGMEPEDLFWEEPCAAVTAEMVTQQDLEASNDWDQLDGFAKDFVNAMPGGEVLYVAGAFTASIYPIGTTGDSYEVTVSD